MLSLLAVSVYAVDPPAMQWHKGYGTSYGNHPHEGMQTSDGGYIAIGQTWDSSDEPEMLVVKTDSSGNEDWQKIVGTSSQPDIGICVAEASDGFICGGGLYSDGNMKPGLVKLDKSTGDIVSGWPKYYSGSQNCCIRGIDILGDGSIVATGYRNAPEAGFLFICDDGDGFIMKTDLSGNSQWDKTLSVPQGTKVRQISGGFAVASCAWYYDGEDHMDAVLIKTDGDGNETNLYRYGGLGTTDFLYDFDLTSDSGYILGGHTVSYGCVNWDYYLVKVNSNFVEEWHKTFGQPRGYDPDYIHDEAYGVRQTPDGGYIIAGGSGDEDSKYSDCSHPAGCSDEWKAYLVKTDSSGNLEWEGVYPNEADVGNTAAEYIGLTSDGGYIVFTDTDCFYDTVGSNAFGFMKIAAEGPPDTAPPTPDPLVWAIVPYATGSSSIAMEATTASDPSGVEYYFSCISGGGHDSGWQDGISYEDIGLLPETQYTYTTKARDKSSNQNQTAESTAESATTEEQGPVDDYANSDIEVSGTVSGSYTDTQASDDAYESITEEESNGKPSNRYSYLEHKWTINVTGGTTVTFNVEAYHSSNSEGDDFVFAYSTDDAAYTDMVTVTNTTDDNTLQSYGLPASTSGTVYVSVVDTDQSQGNNNLDTVYVDQMYITSDGE